jgi:hypothetical protein
VQPVVCRILQTVLVGWLSAVSPAVAQDADALFEEGVVAMQDGRYAEAEESFRAALRIEPSTRVAYNLSTALIAWKRPQSWRGLPPLRRPKPARG